ncbi:TPA: CRISPR-associated endonuclease Cas2 [Candidatus Wolfebacteria bacterium]|uniref:PaaX family transcriptional regulator, phenylacetic acid degradation operon negative regulatory protein n=2 Tax=Candidatus Wolfeibacteriota TaxID=1752735 RepID=A0A0G4ASN4_9BACT|nr:MAG: PaaX family transcriptional regulator, phenylacetic acid degradation operon negative regulatory protein [Candidatus Wolfebacteria bacterium GW2011_GWB1_47_1]HAL24696.1 CRISPR-associated endonuclease Cas2 [Candidatus Wolfebacteria bacterium]HBD18260.1 CRISPR-associated endonuclease Cas2 [Candidatus Wolfebacteria bacterium]HBN87297.1 CRISPR-associated endonuclease Cas2 [Candidatus Wolfebacteria bacterium]HBT74841.1 CRISPR-associated endonuclease Cas2 [Candidatus Wolfebacteria bacterium]
MAKGDLMWGILAVIGMGVMSVIEVSDIILETPYKGTGGGRGKAANITLSPQDAKRAQRRRYDNLVYRLKQQGLLEEVEKEGKKFFRLTAEGKRKLTKSKESPSLPSLYYEKEKDERFVIVMFDIPEQDRKKRAWLRAVLINLGFSMAQKSVWIGKVRIPQTLIDDLVKLDLDDFVEIFQVTKTGNLKHVI